MQLHNCESGYSEWNFRWLSSVTLERVGGCAFIFATTTSSLILSCQTVMTIFTRHSVALETSALNKVPSAVLRPKAAAFW